jgi:hypothetical protein
VTGVQTCALPIYFDKQEIIYGYIGQYFTEIYRFYKTNNIYLEGRSKYEVLEILDEAKTLKYRELIDEIEYQIKIYF